MRSVLPSTCRRAAGGRLRRRRRGQAAVAPPCKPGRPASRAAGTPATQTRPMPSQLRIACVYMQAVCGSRMVRYGVDHGLCAGAALECAPGLPPGAVLLEAEAGRLRAALRAVPGSTLVDIAPVVLGVLPASSLRGTDTAGPARRGASLSPLGGAACTAGRTGHAGVRPAIFRYTVLFLCRRLRDDEGT